MPKSLPHPVAYTGIDVLQTRIDYVSSIRQLIGLAHPNALETNEDWQIKELTFDSSGRVTAIKFARTGNIATNDALFAWSNRLSLSYGPL